VQSAAFASFGTAISLAQELKKGSIDRFRSMPMALGGPLVQHGWQSAVWLVGILAVVGPPAGRAFSRPPPPPARAGCDSPTRWPPW
jgi:hypothetical protein